MATLDATNIAVNMGAAPMCLEERNTTVEKLLITGHARVQDNLKKG